MTKDPNTLDTPAPEPADITTPRDSQPVIANYEGPEDPDAEQLLQALTSAVTAAPDER